MPKSNAPLNSNPWIVPPFPFAGSVIWPIGLMITPAGMEDAVTGSGIPEKSKVPV